MKRKYKEAKPPTRIHLSNQKITKKKMARQEVTIPSSLTTHPTPPHHSGAT